MARFSRLCRSARLLLLAAGFGGLSAGSAWSCIGAQESTQPDIITASKSVAVDAYISGFKAMARTASDQDYGSLPTMANGTTLAQVILKQHAVTGKNYTGFNFNWQHKPVAEIVCAAIAQACQDYAIAVHLDRVSLKFRAIEAIETAALANCREFALNTELCGSTIAAAFAKAPLVDHGTSIQLPTFAFTTVTTTVSVPDGGTIVNGRASDPEFRGNSLRLVKASAVACFEARIAYEQQRGNSEYSQVIYDFSLGMEPSTTLDYQPALDSAEGFFCICRGEEPTVWGEVLKMISSLCPDETPAIDEDAVAPARPLDIVEQLATDSAKQLTISSLCGTHESGIYFRGGFRSFVYRYAPSNELVAPHTIRAERIGVDFDYVQPASNSLVLRVTPRIIITEEEEDRLLGVAHDEETDAPSDFIWSTVEQLATTPRATDCPQAKPISTTQSLEIEIRPLVEPGLLVVNDAAPLENPAPDFVSMLPISADAPLANPAWETSAAHVVSPTMSPLEYAETFLTPAERAAMQANSVIASDSDSGVATIYDPAVIEEEAEAIVDRFNVKLTDPIAVDRDQFHDYNVLPTAHDEPSTTPEPCKSRIPSALQALGGPIQGLECEAETCRGFTIRFAPMTKPAPVAEAQAFDGPAQITLHDGVNCPGQGFIWPAQPAAPTESIDELADRLEREFLQRAVSGQIQSTPPCAAKCETAKEAAACQSDICHSSQRGPSTCQPEQCPADKCQPCHCNPNTCKPSECQPSQCPPGASGLAACVGCPGGLPSEECGTGTSVTQLAFPPRSQWTLPTPAVMFNPYAAGPASCGVPSTFAQPPLATVPPQVALPQQHPGSVWTPALSCRAPSCSVPGFCHGTPTVPPPAPNKTPVSGEALETHREISRTLEQLAERCESQGFYAQADELRGQAQEFRMRARVIHGHLAALPLPPSFGQMLPPMAQPGYTTTPSYYGQQPQTYPVPATYYPEAAPSLAPPQTPIPATYPQPQPQPLPIAQPMMVPRF